MRRLLLVVIALPAALALSGCERLCAPTEAGKLVGVFCPESVDNPLNDQPEAGFVLAYPPAGEDAEPEPLPRADTVETGRDVIVRSTSQDSDGDRLFLEWDLDGDGRFERSGYRSAVGSVDTVIRTAGSRRIKLRVADFPTHLGAPGEATFTRDVLALDRAANRPPRAVLSASPNPAVAGDVVTFDATGSSDPDFYDVGNLGATFFFPERDDVPVPSPGRLQARRRFFTVGTQDVKVNVRDSSACSRLPRSACRWSQGTRVTVRRSRDWSLPRTRSRSAAPEPTTRRRQAIPTVTSSPTAGTPTASSPPTRSSAPATIR